MIWKRFFYKNSLHCLNIVTHSEWPWAWLLSEWERNSAPRAYLVKWSRKKILTGGEKRGLNSRGAGEIGGLTMTASIKSLCLLLCLAIVQGKNNHESSSSPTSSTVIFEWKSSREILVAWKLASRAKALMMSGWSDIWSSLLVTFQLSISRS